LIEKQRRNQFATTTDSQDDESVFIFCTQNIAEPVLFEKTANLKHYNVRINPLRNALNYRRELASSVAMGVGGNLKQKARTGAELNIEQHNFSLAGACDLNGGNIMYENLPIALFNPLYKPIFAGFEYPLTLEEFENIKINSRQKISFTTCCNFLTGEMQTQIGYIEDVRHKPNEGTGDFKLLLE
jgi:hypothetical protein